MPNIVDPAPYLAREDELLENLFNVLSRVTLDRSGLELLVETLQTPVESEHLKEAFKFGVGFATEKENRFVKFRLNRLFKDGQPTRHFRHAFHPEIKIREGVEDREGYILGKLIYETIHALGIRYALRKQSIMMDALLHRHEAMPSDYVTQVTANLGKIYGYMLALGLFNGNLHKVFYQIDQVWQSLKKRRQRDSGLTMRALTEGTHLTAVQLGYDDSLYWQVLAQGYVWLNNNIEILNDENHEHHKVAKQIWLGLYRFYDVLSKVRGTEGEARLQAVKAAFVDHSRLFKIAITSNLKREGLPDKDIYHNFPELRRYAYRF